MSEDGPRLTVIGTSEAFADAWDDLAARAGLGLLRLERPEPIREKGSVAVVLAVGGEETRAVDLLHAAHRAGIEGPIVVGAATDHRIAVELMRRGAMAYFALPGDLDRLETELRERAAAAQPPAEGEALGEYHRRAYDFSALVGEDEALQAALDRAARVIPGGKATVLITGETGTGKELLAQAIHYNGPRASEPFVAVNCSAIPPNLLESELFGHEKGAFTDARAAKPGLFEVADGGTLFFDEVATLPLDLQGKLLRVLETREVRRVGGVRDTRVDVRVLAAANVDLARQVREGAFREDLYYRLAVVPIHLPPLRERGGDLLVLARHFLATLAREYGMDPPELRKDAVVAILRHSWPGNVRELRNAMERALLLSGGLPAGPEHLALDDAPAAASVSAPAGAGSAGGLPFPASLKQIEEAAARAAVARCDGNKSEAARVLGITRTRLYRLLSEEA
ncbi:MAG: sigma-54 dependent transcriptional regulator [Gemmatimonadota bacterium]